MALQVRELTSWDEASDLEAKREQLVTRNATDTVFLSYAWLRTWWQHFGKGSRLLLLVVESGDELVGAAPLMIDRQPLLEGGAARVRFTANWQTMRMDLLAAPECRPAVMAALTGYLLQHASHWDVLDLDLVPAESENLAALEAELRSRCLRVERVHRWDSPYLPLCGDWEKQLKQFSRRWKRKISYELRRVQRQPEVRYVSSGTGLARDVLEGSFEVSRRPWQGRLGPTSSINSSPEMARFYADL